MHDCLRVTRAEFDELGLGAMRLRLADLGVATLPLRRGAKKPHPMLGDRGGVHHATLDLDIIWQQGRADRAASIGAAMGLASRRIVIDIDAKNGHDGHEELDRFLRDSRLEIPPGPVVRTPSGGTHVWLAWPWSTPAPKRTGILPGVDVIGCGGYAVVPPSMLFITALREQEPVPVPYAWRGCPCSAPAAPGWIPGWLERNPGPPPGTADLIPRPDLPSQARLEESPPPPGERNDTLSRHCVRLFLQCGTSPPGERRVRAKMTRILDGMDRSGWRPGELDWIISSGRSRADEIRAEDRALLGRWVP